VTFPGVAAARHQNEGLLADVETTEATTDVDTFEIDDVLDEIDEVLEENAEE
jgi:ubiquitin-like protein Pup